MRLNDFGWKQGDRNLNGTGTAEQAPVSEEARNYHIRQQIRSFMPGQTLQGKVVGINGREIQIQADGDMVFQARLDGDMSVDVGKIMTFEVQSRTGKLLALRPLFENMGTDANVLKALDMAGLPVNSITVAMTEGLMTEGMPIDKHTLQQFYKLTTAHPDTNPVSFVQLQKLGMEITPENLSQLESYKALEHQLIKGMADVIEELPMQFQAMVQQGNVDAAVQMYFDILQIATEEIIESVTESVTEAATESVTELATESVTESATESVTEEQPELLSATRPEIQTEEVPDRVKEEEAVEHQKAAITGSEEQRGAGRVQGTAISELLNAGEREELAVLLKSAGVDDSTVEAVLHGDKEGMTARELLQQIRTQVLAEDGSVKPDASELFGSREYHQLLRAELNGQWTLQPEEVRRGNQVDELYRRLNTELSKFSEAVFNNVKGDSPLAQNISHLQHNIEFMNQMNQLAAYVQLPLKMNGQNTHGELYVYTNKKSLARADGNVSALLHLDMEHLGPVDVYVTMQKQRVNTNFYLQDDNLLDFLQEHMYLLNERLAKRGYTLHSELLLRQETTNVMEEMIKTNRNVTRVSQYSFDVRA